MAKQHNPKTLPAPSGPYSMGIEVGPNARTLHIAGQLGMKADGTMAEGFEAQAKQAWENLIALLKAADMTVDNLVKLTAYVTDVAQVPLYGPIREGFLGQARPASTLIVAKALARPNWLFEIDGVAAKE